MFASKRFLTKMRLSLFNKNALEVISKKVTGDRIAVVVDNVIDSAIIVAYSTAAWAMAARALGLRLRAVSSQLAALVVLPVKQGDDANDDECERAGFSDRDSGFGFRRRDA